MITRELRISLAVIRISAFFGIVMVGNALWRFTTHRVGPSKSSGKDHLPNRAVRHREVPETIRIPPAPDASAIALAGSPLLCRVSISAGARVQRSGNRNQESQNSRLTLTKHCTTIWLSIISVQQSRLCLIQPAGQ